MFLAEKRKLRGRHARLADMVQAFNPGDGKALTRQFEEWEKDAF